MDALIQGIIHAAGVLYDNIIPNLDESSFKDVFAPKVNGALHLDNLVRNISLEFFVMFSSVASGFGSPGQANYGAANSVLDELANNGRKMGHPYLSIRWGAWKEGGMANDETFKRLGRTGMLPLRPERGLTILLDLVSHLEVSKAVVTVCPLDKNKLPQDVSLFEHLVKSYSDNSKSNGIFTDDFYIQDSDTQISNIVTMLLNLALELGASDSIQPNTPWRDAGLDSLSMVEFRNILSRQLGDKIKLSDSILVDYHNSFELASYIENN